MRIRPVEAGAGTRPMGWNGPAARLRCVTVSSVRHGRARVADARCTRTRAAAAAVVPTHRSRARGDGSWHRHCAGPSSGPVRGGPSGAGARAMAADAGAAPDALSVRSDDDAFGAFADPRHIDWPPAAFADHAAPALVPSSSAAEWPASSTASAAATVMAATPPWPAVEPAAEVGARSRSAATTDHSAIVVRTSLQRRYSG